MKKNVIGIVVIGAVVASGAFYAGIQYGKGKSASAAQARFSGMTGGQFGQGGSGARGSRMGGAGGATSGVVLAKDDKSITIKLRDGGSKIVFFSTSTQVQKSTEGSVSDIGVGGEVVVLGGANTDGSVTAQSIQIRPISPVVK